MTGTGAAAGSAGIGGARVEIIEKKGSIEREFKFLYEVSKMQV